MSLLHMNNEMVTRMMMTMMMGCSYSVVGCAPGIVLNSPHTPFRLSLRITLVS